MTTRHKRLANRIAEVADPTFHATAGWIDPEGNTHSVAGTLHGDFLRKFSLKYQNYGEWPELRLLHHFLDKGWLTYRYLGSGHWVFRAARLDDRAMANLKKLAEQYRQYPDHTFSIYSEKGVLGNFTIAHLTGQPEEPTQPPVRKPGFKGPPKGVLKKADKIPEIHKTCTMVEAGEDGKGHGRFFGRCGHMIRQCRCKHGSDNPLRIYKITDRDCARCEGYKSEWDRPVKASKKAGPLLEMEYPAGWIDPQGKVYEVGETMHEDFLRSLSIKYSDPVEWPEEELLSHFLHKGWMTYRYFGNGSWAIRAEKLTPNTPQQLKKLSYKYPSYPSTQMTVHSPTGILKRYKREELTAPTSSKRSVGYNKREAATVLSNPVPRPQSKPGYRRRQPR